jgi:hypothetical protein
MYHRNVGTLATPAWQNPPTAESTSTVNHYENPKYGNLGHLGTALFLFNYLETDLRKSE